MAEKAGFIAEIIQPEVIKWEGQWGDPVNCGTLRHEWANKKTPWIK